MVCMHVPGGAGNNASSRARHSTQAARAPGRHTCAICVLLMVPRSLSCRSSAASAGALSGCSNAASTALLTSSWW